MQPETLHDIHKRLGIIEQDTKAILAHAETLRWTRWHIRALWGAILALLGLKGLGH